MVMPSETPEVDTRIISAAELAEHGTSGPGALWLVLHGKVFDVSSFVSKHPGGEAPILAVCGLATTKGTEQFNAVGHSASALSKLDSLQVGTLDETALLVSEAADHEESTSSEAAEWHAVRRRQMLAMYPEIEALFRQDWVPWFYGSCCLVSFVTVGLYVLPRVSWLVVFILAWTLLPWLSFGLNNMNHEICHGRLLGLRQEPCRKSLANLVMFANGVCTLNHFQFYYYYHSHLSHHRVLGANDRTRAYRKTYFGFGFAEETKVAERQWDVDGDLFGLHPFLLVRDMKSPKGLECIHTLASFFADPTTSFIEQRQCLLAGTCSSESVLLRVAGMTFIFAIFRVWVDVFALLNAMFSVCFCMGTCAIIRRPWQCSMVSSFVAIVVMHAVYFYVGGIKCWLGVWISAWAQPTFIPFSLYFGYFTAIHAGCDINGDCQPTRSIYGVFSYILTFGQSLHLEHHDFPQIPCRFLPRLRRIAPEFYSMPRVRYYKSFWHPWWEYFIERRGKVAYASCVESLHINDVQTPDEQELHFPEGFVDATLKVAPLQHTASTVLLQLEAPELRRVPPGAHVLLGLYTSDGTWVERPYTPISSDGFSARFLVKVYPGGVMSPRIAQLRAGDRIGVHGPCGQCLLGRLSGCVDVRLVAAGTGIAPMLPLARGLLSNSSNLPATTGEVYGQCSTCNVPRVRILSCQQSRSLAPLVKDLEELALASDVVRDCKPEVCSSSRERAAACEIVHFLSADSDQAGDAPCPDLGTGPVLAGRFSRKLLEQAGLLSPPPCAGSAAVVICGPPSFCAAATEVFKTEEIAYVASSNQKDSIAVVVL